MVQIRAEAWQAWADLVVKPRVLVLGSFQRTAGDDRIGGLSFACQALVASTLAESYDFVPVDSTLRTIRPGSGLLRAPAAMIRFFQTLWHLGPRRVGTALCFASAGASFIEKGCLVVVGNWLGRRMVLMPRSGPIVGQIARSPLFRRFVQVVLRRAHRVVCQSETWRTYYHGLVSDTPWSKFVVIENWLPASAFIESQAPCAGSGQADRFVVGYMSRIEVAKGVFDFIEAVRIAHASNPAIRGVIHGDGHALEEVSARLGDPALAGVIHYGGWVDGADKRAAMRRLDAFLFTSHAEGFPNALLEVLALKVPVVSVRVGAVVDLLENGQSALLAEIGDAETLAGHLLALAADSGMCHRLAEQAYRRVCCDNALPSAIARFREVLA